MLRYGSILFFLILKRLITAVFYSKMRQSGTMCWWWKWF